MNRIQRIGIVIGSVLLGFLTARTTAADVSVDVVIHSESDFYEPLTPHGEWVVVGSYGRCWRPARVEADWQPYSNGSWERTDAGWYWISDEPWGWATYHYGRWDMNAEFGWFWVPQIVWAPAWVSWHEGGGYIGWAPLSPAGHVNVQVISPRIVFVEQRHFLEPVRRKTVIVNNTTIINKTVINNGPQTAVVEKSTGHKVQQVQVRELRHKEEAVVVAKQRVAAPANAKKEKQVSPAPVPRPVEKVVVAPPVTETPVPKKVTHDLETQKPAPQQVRPDEESRARQPAPKPEVKPEAEQPGKHDAKHDAKPDGEKRDQKDNKGDKESEKKAEEPPTP